jgi:hypothetical protein
MTNGLVVPAVAETCGDIFAVARLDANGAGTCQGAGIVFSSSAVDLVEFDSVFDGPPVEQVGHVDAGAST